MSFASVADVEALLRRQITSQESAFVLRLLEMADEAIKAELPGVHFDGVVTGATAVFRLVVQDAEIWLPDRPVNQVAQVRVDGEVLDPRRYVVSPWGPLRIRGGNWATWREIEVTWDYGLAAPPGDVVNVAAGLVEDAVSDSGGKRQVTIGQYSETNEPSKPGGPLALSSADVRRLRRYKPSRTSIPIESANPWWDIPRTRGPWPLEV